MTYKIYINKLKISIILNAFNQKTKLSTYLSTGCYLNNISNIINKR